MSYPVGGSPSKSNPSNAPGQQPDSGGDAASRIAEGVLRSRDSSPPAPLSSRVSAGEVRPSKEVILNQWLASQPEDAKEEAQQIVKFLGGIDLENHFYCDLPPFKKISSLPEVFQNCVGFRCIDSSLVFLPKLPECIEIQLQMLPNIALIPRLPECRNFYCMNCPNLEMVLPLPKCIVFSVSDCTRLLQICDLTECMVITCYGCSSLEHLPEKLPWCGKLDCLNCPELKFLPEFSKINTLSIDGCLKLLENIGYKVANYNIVDGVIYLPVSLPEDLKVPLTPPLPEGASIGNLNSDLQTFILELEEADLPRLQKEIPDREDLEGYKQKLTLWNNLLFERVANKTPYLGTPRAGSDELNQFYNQIEYYLVHLGAFLSKEENQDAFTERLQILQTQSACGARFIAELEQLFSLNCVGGETADLSNQFAQIASTEAKLKIEGMFPGGNVHPINQAMFQLRDYLTGTYTRDQLSHDFDQGDLLTSFLSWHNSTNLVKTIQDNLKPSSPKEELFTQYLKENFSPELSKEQLDEVIRDVNDIWKATKERKIAAFETIDRIRKKPVQERTTQEKFQMLTTILTDEEKTRENKKNLEELLESKEQSFKDTNIKSGVESIKDEILYQEHFDEEANRWKPEIIAKALQKMGILATLEQLVPPRPS